MYGTYNMAQWLHYGNRNADKATAEALEVAAGDVANALWAILYPCTVKFFGFEVTVAFDYDTQTAEGIIALDKRVTPASDTGRVEVARVDLEDGLAIGDVRGLLGTDMGTDAFCQPGDELVLEVVTAGTGGGSIAGDWRPIIILAPYDEVPENCTGWTLSDVTQV